MGARLRQSGGGKVGGGEGGVMDAGEGWAAQSTDPSHLEGPRTASQSRQALQRDLEGEEGEKRPQQREQSLVQVLSGASPQLSPESPAQRQEPSPPPCGFEVADLV